MGEGRQAEQVYGRCEEPGAVEAHHEQGGMRGVGNRCGEFFEPQNLSEFNNHLVTGCGWKLKYLL